MAEVALVRETGVRHLRLGQVTGLPEEFLAAPHLSDEILREARNSLMLN